MAKGSARKRGTKRTSAGSGDAKRRKRTKSSTAPAAGDGDVPAGDAPKTEGQRQLLAVDGSLSAIASKLGGSKQMVSCWRRGTKLPGNANREKLARVYGIESAAWDRAPSEDAAPPAKPAGPAPAPPLPAPTRSTLEEVEHELETLRSLSREPDLTAATRARLSDSRTKLIALRARLEREEELIEDRLVREHPMWLRIRGVLEDFVTRLGAKDAKEMRDAIASLEG